MNPKDKRFQSNYLKYYVNSTGVLTENWNFILQPTIFVKKKSIALHSINGTLQTSRGP